MCLWTLSINQILDGLKPKWVLQDSCLKIICALLSINTQIEKLIKSIRLTTCPITWFNPENDQNRMNEIATEQNVLRSQSSFLASCVDISNNMNVFDAKPVAMQADNDNNIGIDFDNNCDHSCYLSHWTTDVFSFWEFFFAFFIIIFAFTGSNLRH